MIKLGQKYIVMKKEPYLSDNGRIIMMGTLISKTMFYDVGFVFHFKTKDSNDDCITVPVDMSDYKFIRYGHLPKIGEQIVAKCFPYHGLSLTKIEDPIYSNDICDILDIIPKIGEQSTLLYVKCHSTDRYKVIKFSQLCCYKSDTNTK